MSASAIAKTTFAKQTVTIGAPERIALRKLCQDIGVQCSPGDESLRVRDALQKLLSLANQSGGPAPLPECPSTITIQEMLDLEGNDRLKQALEHADELRGWYSEWAALAAKAGQRGPAWETLKRLLVHAADFTPAQDVAAKAEAVERNRLLLAEPDQVTPLINELTGSLRGEIQSLHARIGEAVSSAHEGLAADQNWSSLEQAKQEELFGKHHLSAPPDPDLGSVASVVAALDGARLDARRSELAAVPARADAARIEAAQLLTPKARALTLPRRTLSTPGDVEEYAAEVKALLEAEIKQGPVVVS